MKNETEENEKPEYPNNIERTFYEITIDDIKKRIQRLETRNEQLSEIHDETERDITSKDIDTTNEIAQLNRDLSAKLSKIVDAQKTIDTLTNQRVDEQNRHDSKINFIKQMHETARIELLSQIKITNAKINSLEDFHNNEEAIREKINENDNFLVEKEKKLADKFNQIDVKSKIFHAKLMDDLKTQIFQLSESLACDNLKRIPYSINKLFKENAAIRDELDLINLYMTNKKDNSLIINSESIKRSQWNTNNNLTALKSQKNLIEVMAKNYNNVTPISDKILDDYDTRIERLQSAISCSNKQIAELKYLLQRKTCQLTETKKFHDKIRRNIDKYSDALYDVKYAIACALEIEDTGPEILSLTMTQFITHLSKLANKLNI
ncbi:uncharacterized protein LOC130675365 isoform X2 [Microplitis mediator]|uniref:uncharacterized protein LOC130675365 isoform X2 n=1 Tax=Microplitis mediator TaxID=375433 RepID=UPI002555A190|nr:uncharacterized protein LOC130675365 isoform X2 [Microplitis mediator]